MTPGPWKVRMFPRSPERWNRVEREGAHETEQPVALVKDPQDAIAFAALHEVTTALEELASKGSAFSPATQEIARLALAAMKGERR